MKQTRDELYIAADAVSRTSSEWHPLLNELRRYATDVTMAVLKATPQDLPCAQGRSQEAWNIVAILETCRDYAAKIKSRDTIVSPSPTLSQRMPGQNSAGAKQRES